LFTLDDVAGGSGSAGAGGSGNDDGSGGDNDNGEGSRVGDVVSDSVVAAADTALGRVLQQVNNSSSGTRMVTVQRGVESMVSAGEERGLNETERARAVLDYEMEEVRTVMAALLLRVEDAVKREERETRRLQKLEAEVQPFSVVNLPGAKLGTGAGGGKVKVLNADVGDEATARTTRVNTFELLGLGKGQGKGKVKGKGGAMWVCGACTYENTTIFKCAMCGKGKRPPNSKGALDGEGSCDRNGVGEDGDNCNDTDDADEEMAVAVGHAEQGQQQRQQQQQHHGVAAVSGAGTGTATMPSPSLATEVVVCVKETAAVREGNSGGGGGDIDDGAVTCAKQMEPAVLNTPVVTSKTTNPVATDMTPVAVGGGDSPGASVNTSVVGGETAAVSDGAVAGGSGVEYVGAGVSGAAATSASSTATSGTGRSLMVSEFSLISPVCKQEGGDDSKLPDGQKAVKPVTLLQNMRLLHAKQQRKSANISKGGKRKRKTPTPPSARKRLINTKTNTKGKVPVSIRGGGAGGFFKKQKLDEDEDEAAAVVIEIASSESDEEGPSGNCA
jgi:hypothetical protein